MNFIFNQSEYMNSMKALGHQGEGVIKARIQKSWLSSSKLFLHESAEKAEGHTLLIM